MRYWLVSALLLAGCSPLSGWVTGPQAPNDPEPSAGAPVASSVDLNLYPANKTVCDPFSGPEAPRADGGLRAELYSLTPEQTRYTRTTDYLAFGSKSEQTLFFTSLNVPTRRFEQGFSNQAGEKVKDKAGAPLIEYFALKFKTVLKLAPDQEPGEYEFALLSDDGAVLRVRDETGVYREVVDNDGLHQARFGCGSETVTLARDSEHLMQIDYFQGPRFHMALIPMMRKVVATTETDPACGETGSRLFFDEDTSVPLPLYQEIIARGWRPLAADNYSLPLEAVYNPCVQGTAPLISGFSVNSVGKDFAILTWETDISSSSQVSFSAETAESSLITPSDNLLRRRHRVRISNLNPDSVYIVRAVSATSEQGQALSSPLLVRTDSK